nr:hypothetical protein [Tanacetum cinerariifolium]
MDMTIDQQVALNEAFVPHTSRLRIRKSNFHLRSDITSKESTLQLVYDVLRLTPFYKAFLVTADVPEIYMQEFWATTIVHHHSIRFKMNNKKCIINLKYFKEMLHICPRLPNQTFDELQFEEEILAFLRYLGHTVINKCLSGKSTGYDSLRLSQAQILWGMYHKKNADFAYLLWEDFVYQVKHKDAKKSNEMYYPRFTKVIIHFFMTKDPSIPRRNKVNWHYVRDDQMFMTIKLVSRHQNTQQFGAILSIELTNEDVRNFAAYKEYYAVASGAAPPKTKASVRKTRSSSNTIITPPTAASTRLLTSAKGKQPAKSSKAKGVLDVPTDESDEEISWKSSDEDDDDEVDDRSDDQEDEDDQDDDDQKDDDQNDNDDDQDTDNDGDDFVHPKLSIYEEEAKDEESFNLIVQTLKNSDDEGNDDASLGMIVSDEEGQDAEDDDEELYRDVNINLEGRDIQMTDVHTTQEFEDTHVTLTLFNPDGQQQSSSVSSQFVTSMLNPSLDAGIDSFFESTPWVDVQASTTVAPLTLTAPTLPPPTNPTISQVPQAPTPPTTAPSTFLQDLLNFFDGAVFSIPGIVERYMDQRMNEAVKVAVQIQSDRLQDEAQDINEEDSVTFKRHRDDADKDEEPSVGSDRGSKRRREGKEPESTSVLKKKATKTTGKSTEGSKSHQKTASEFAPAEEPMQTTQDLEEPSHQEFETATHESIQPWTRDIAKQADSRSSFNELMDTPVDFSAFLMNQLIVDTLTPKFLAGPTYELMKGSCKSLVELEFFLKEFYGFTVNRESARDVYSKCRIVTVIKLQIVEWHNYKYLDWITVRKLTNLTVEELFAINVSLRMITRSIVIQQRVEDLQLGVESYQKKLNLTKPDTYRFDLKRKEAYTTYSNPRGFIY